MPGLVIVAHGADKSVGIHRVDRNDLVVRIGYVTWILADKLAFRSMTEAWESALQAGPDYLPRHPTRTASPTTNTATPGQRRIFPSPPVPDPVKPTRLDLYLADVERWGGHMDA